MVSIRSSQDWQVHRPDVGHIIEDKSLEASGNRIQTRNDSYVTYPGDILVEEKVQLVHFPHQPPGNCFLHLGCLRPGELHKFKQIL